MNIDFLSLHLLHEPQALPSSLVWEKWQGFYNMRGALQGLSLKVLHLMWRRCSRQEMSLLWRTSLQSIFVFVIEETSHPYRYLPLALWHGVLLVQGGCFGVLGTWSLVIMGISAKTPGMGGVFYLYSHMWCLRCGAQLITWWSVQGKTKG